MEPTRSIPDGESGPPLTERDKSRSIGETERSREVPTRMFALGEEPVGVRVTPYHKPFAISKILRALEEDELEVLRRSPFGKLVDIAERPTFSGRFGRYIMSRQLKVRKKHEAWFLFAGKPIRFSLREFALVTGLNCRPYPPTTKRKAKNHINDKPYWCERFGTLKEVPVSSVVRMLKKRNVTDRETRIKYTFLALLASVILPTCHTPRISHEHAEKIKDLEGFLAYPWGRLSFELLMSSMKERNEVSLSQNTIALKGFVLALQLVMIEAVMALTEAVRDGDSSASECDGEDDDEVPDEERKGKTSISPGNAREIDCAGKVHVLSIIEMGNVAADCQSQYGWSDEEEDVGVDNLVQLIEAGFPFAHSFFTGGASKVDVAQMREQTRIEAEGRKANKQKAKQNSVNAVDVEYVANSVKASVEEQINRIETQMKIHGEMLGGLEKKLISTMQETWSKFQGELLKMLSDRGNMSPSPNREELYRHDVRVNSTTLQNLDESTNLPVGGDIPGNHIRAESELPSEARDISKENNLFDNDGGSLFRQGVEEYRQGMEEFGKNKASSGNGGRSEGRAASPGEDDATHIIEDALVFAKEATLPISNEETATVNLVLSGGGNSETTNPSAPEGDSGLDPALVFPIPTFSLGLSQAEAKKGDSKGETICEVTIVSETKDAVAEAVPEVEVPLLPCRKSKRQKVLPKSLVGDYECDKNFLSRAWESHVAGKMTDDSIDVAAKFSQVIDMLKTPFSFKVNGLQVDSKDLTAMVEKSSHTPPKVLDLLIQHTRAASNANGGRNAEQNYAFLDTKFVAQFSKVYGRFSKVVKKESFKFPAALSASFAAGCPNIEATKFYFPFNFDKTHWVGVCIDATTWQMVVLDCNNSIRSDAMMCKEMRAFAVMFPFLLRHARKQICVKDMKPLSFDRPKVVPQNLIPFESGVTTVILIQAHAFGGIEVCKCIHPSVVAAEVERVVVTLVETHHGLI